MATAPSAASVTTLSRSWPYSSAWRLSSACRQSPRPAASAYSNVWLQCCSENALPSGVVRRSPSIQIPDGHALHDRISDMCRVPSGVTTPPGVPRLKTATDRSASVSSSGSAPSAGGTSTTASPRSSISARTAVASPVGPLPATISTGRSRDPRRSALGANASARDRRPGTHTRAEPDAASCVASDVPYSGPDTARTLELNVFKFGPPSAMRTSGRLESASIAPYLGPSA